MSAITLKYKSDEEFVAENESGNKLDIDMLPSDQKNHQSPMEILLSAVTACAAVDIVSMIKKRRKTFVDFTAEAEGNRQDEHPRRFADIHIKYIVTSPDLKDEELERIVDLAVSKYCSVAATLNSNITHSFEIVR